MGREPRRGQRIFADDGRLVPTVRLRGRRGQEVRVGGCDESVQHQADRPSRLGPDGQPRFVIFNVFAINFRVDLKNSEPKKFIFED